MIWEWKRTRVSLYSRVDNIKWTLQYNVVEWFYLANGHYRAIISERCARCIQNAGFDATCLIRESQSAMKSCVPLKHQSGPTGMVCSALRPDQSGTGCKCWTTYCVRIASHRRWLQARLTTAAMEMLHNDLTRCRSQQWLSSTQKQSCNSLTCIYCAISLCSSDCISMDGVIIIRKYVTTMAETI